MKSRIYLRTFFCFAIIIATPTFSQQSKLDSIEHRIGNLEDYKANLSQLYEINLQKLSKAVDERVEEKIKDIDESKRILKWLVYLGIPASLLGLLATYYGAVKKAKKIIMDRIENIVEHKRDEIIKLIETQEFDSKMRATKKLLVLSLNDGANDSIKKIISKLNFKYVNYRVIKQYIQYDDYDLIIFNDSDGSFPQSVIDDYLSNIPDDNVSFVAYTIKNLARNSRINFSNSPFTLYHNILSTLKYSEILKII